MNPTVGIVVPARNAGRFLARTLESVAAQTVADWRCVVVVNASADDTADVAARFACEDGRFRVVESGESGVSRARNLGTAAVADLGFTALLDADDSYEPDALAVLLDALGDGPDRPGTHGVASFVDEAGDPHPDPPTDRNRRFVAEGGRLRELDPGEPTDRRALATWPCVVTPGTTLLRTSAVAAAGGFDPSLRIGEDWHFWHRLARRGPLAFVPRPTVRYRLHAGGANGAWDRPLQLARARRAIRADAASWPELPEHAAYCREAARVVRRHLSRAHAAAALDSLRHARVLPAAKCLAAAGANGLLARV